MEGRGAASERGKMKEKRGKRKEAREKEEKRENIFFEKGVKTKIHQTNCHIMIRKKKKNRRTELFGIFLRKFRISPCFKLISRVEFDFRAPWN